jgi:hypothetical protein
MKRNCDATRFWADELEAITWEAVEKSSDPDALAATLAQQRRRLWRLYGSKLTNTAAEVQPRSCDPPLDFQEDVVASARVQTVNVVFSLLAQGGARKYGQHHVDSYILLKIKRRVA